MSGEDELRAAATKLRTLAGAATPGPWNRDYNYIVGMVPGGRPGGEVIGQATTSVAGLLGVGQEKANAEFIAGMHPGVVLALADCLDVIAEDVGTSSIAYHAALAVARTANGGAS